MLLSTEIEVKWHPQTKQHYIDKGYTYTKLHDSFMAKVEDLTTGTHKRVEVECDYCHKHFTKEYTVYLSEHSINNKDACFKCRPLKSKEIFEDKYGVSNPFQLQSCKDKIKQTCLDRYGVENPGQAKEIKDKIAQTNMDKYGNKCTLCSDVIKEKAKATCRERYGVDNVFESKEIQEVIKATHEAKYGKGNIAHTPEIAERIKLNNMEKYGVPYVTQVPEIIAKMRTSLYRNHGAPTSKPEQELCEMLHRLYGKDNCKEGYPLNRINMDCLLTYDGCKIDVEYDGWYWHKNRVDYDNKRNNFVIEQGYKVLRVRSYDKLPTEQQLKEAIDYLVKGNHSITFIDLDI